MILLNFLKHFKYVSKFEMRKYILSSCLVLPFISQVQLEEFRNSEHELRWKADEDYSDCQNCHGSFSVTWRKYHCRKL